MKNLPRLLAILALALGFAAFLGACTIKNAPAIIITGIVTIFALVVMKKISAG